MRRGRDGDNSLEVGLHAGHRGRQGTELLQVPLQPRLRRRNTRLHTGMDFNRVFHKHTTLAIMPIWHQRLYYVKTEKSSDKMLPTVRIDPRPLITCNSKSNTLLSELTGHLLVRLRLYAPYVFMPILKSKVLKYWID